MGGAKKYLARALLVLLITTGIVLLFLQRVADKPFILSANTTEFQFTLERSEALHARGRLRLVEAVGFARIELWTSPGIRYALPDPSQVRLVPVTDADIAITAFPLPPAREVSVIAGPAGGEFRTIVRRDTSSAAAVEVALDGSILVNNHDVKFERGRATLEWGAETNELWMQFDPTAGDERATDQASRGPAAEATPGLYADGLRTARRLSFAKSFSDTSRESPGPPCTGCRCASAIRDGWLAFSTERGAPQLDLDARRLCVDLRDATLSMQRPKTPESGSTIAITVQGICTSAQSGDANILPRRIETWSMNQVLVTVIATLTGALGVLLQLVGLWKSWRSEA